MTTRVAWPDLGRTALRRWLAPAALLGLVVANAVRHDTERPGSVIAQPGTTPTASASVATTPFGTPTARWPAAPVAPEAVIVPWFELSLGELPFEIEPVNGTQWTWVDGIAVLSGGDLAVADARTQHVRRLAPDGRTRAEWGGFDVGRQGLFDGPADVAEAPDGSLWVADRGNRRLQRFDRDGRYAGGFEVPADGSTGAPAVVAIGHARPDLLYTLAVPDHHVTVYSSDGTVIRRFKAATRCGDDQPLAIDVAPDGTVVVAYGRGGCALRFTADGTEIGRIGAPAPTATLPAERVRSGTTSDGPGNNLFADTGASAAPSTAQDGPPCPLGTYEVPSGLAIADDGTVWIADYGRRCVFRVAPDGSPAGGWTTDGGAWPAGSQPGDIDVAPDGTLWVGRQWSGEGAAQATMLHLNPDGTVIGGFTRSPRQGALTNVRGIAQTDDGALWLNDAGTGRIVALVNGQLAVDHRFDARNRTKIRSVHAASDGSVFATAREGIFRVDALGAKRYDPIDSRTMSSGEVHGVLPPESKGWGFLFGCRWYNFVTGPTPVTHYVHGLSPDVCDAFDAERVGDRRYALLWPHRFGKPRTMPPSIFEITDEGADPEQADPEFAKLPDDLGLGAAGWSDPRFAAAGRSGFWLSEVGDRWWINGAATNPPRAYLLDSEGGVVTRWGEAPGPYKLLGPVDIAGGRADGVSAWVCDCPPASPPNTHRLIAYGPPATDRWHIAYYANRGLTDWPVKTAWRDGVPLSMHWGAAPPARGLAPGTFTARFQRPLVVSPEASGTHHVRLHAQGAIRLWVDDRLLVDEPAGPVADEEHRIQLSEGVHRLRIDYRALDASASLSFTLTSLAPVGTPRPSATPTPTRTPTATRTASPTPVPTATWPAMLATPESVLVPWFEQPLGPPPPDGFAGPEGITALADGSVAIADARTQRVVRIGTDGRVAALWGGFDLSRSGLFNSPWDVAEDLDGTLWVPDSYNRRLQHFDRDGRRLGGFGVTGGVPFAIAIGAARPAWLYTLSFPDPNVTIYEPSGAVRSRFAATSRCGSGQPMAIDVARDGTVVVGYNGLGCVLRFDADGIELGRIGAPDPSATPTSTATSTASPTATITPGPSPTPTQWTYPLRGDRLHAGDRWPLARRSRPAAADGARHHASKAAATAAVADATAAEAAVSPPPCQDATYRATYGLAVDDDGGTWIADRARLCLFRIRADGTPAEAWSTDGGDWPKAFAPWDIDVAPDGSLWVSGRSEVGAGVAAGTAGASDASGASGASDAVAAVASDAAEGRTIVHVSSSGVVLERFGRQSPASDVSTVAGIAQGPDGLLWLADADSSRVIGLDGGRKAVDWTVPVRSTELRGIDVGDDGVASVVSLSNVWRVDRAGVTAAYASNTHGGANDAAAVVVPDARGWAFLRDSCHVAAVDPFDRERAAYLGDPNWDAKQRRCQAFDLLRIPGFDGVIALARVWREGGEPAFPALYQRFGIADFPSPSPLPDDLGLGAAGWLAPRIAASPDGSVWLTERGNAEPLTGQGSVPPRAYRTQVHRLLTRWGDQPDAFALLGPVDVADGRADGVAAWVLDAPAAYAASAQRLIAYAPPSVDRWHAAFYVDRWLTGWPVATGWRDGMALAEDWGAVPPPDGVPARGFGARFQRPLVVAPDAAGAHTLIVRARGAVRVWVDDRLFVDGPVGPGVDAVHRVDLAPGLHRLRVEYGDVVDGDGRIDGGTGGEVEAGRISLDLTAGAPVLAPAYLPWALARWAVDP